MVEDRNSKLAKEHYEKAEDYTKQAGQHTASAASTVGHDLRAAGEQLAEAGKSIGSRITAPAGGKDTKSVGDRAQETVDKAGAHARSTADEAADSTKSTYNKLKSSINDFLGGAKHSDKPVSDAAHKTADTVNKGVDKAHEGQRKVYESTPSQGDVKVEGREALESAKDSAVHAKNAVVGGLSYMGGRLTAPVSGEEETDADLANKAKAKTRSAADAVSSGAQKAQDKTAEAAEEAKQQSKGLFSSIRDAFSQPAADKDSAIDKAHHDTATLQDKAKNAIGDAQDKVKGSVEEAKKQLIEAAEAAQPKTEAEAILSQGGIPSNTADLLKQRETSETADRAVHEGTQGTHLGVDSFLSKTAEAWGGDNLTGDGGLSSVRDAADQAGPHSRMS